MREKRWVTLLIGFLLLFALSHQTVEASEEKRFIIGFKDGIREEALAPYEGQVLAKLEGIHAVVAELSDAQVNELKQHEAITYIEKDQRLRANGQIVDWGVQKIGAETAWKNGLTGKGVKIAILDTGVDAEHPDLRVEQGKSFVEYTTSYKDDNGHGSHVAGIIAARNNDIGVIGVAHDASLYVAKVLDEAGDGYTSDVVKAIQWALDNDVDIINLSISGHRPSTALETMLNKAYKSGTLIIAAAGNFGKQDGSGLTVDYPALYESVIAVSAVDQNMRRAPFSATGPEVEVTAPGVGIYSTYLNQSYKHISGTSMAAPHVTGHLALLRQAYPQATNDELRKMLHAQTLDIGTQGRDPKYGYGLIQIPADLRAEAPRPLPPTIQLGKQTWENGQAYVELKWKPAEEGERAVAYELYRNDKKVATLEETTFTDTVSPGVYTYTVKALNKEKGASNKAKPITVTIKEDQTPIVIDTFTDVTGEEWFAHSIYELVSKEIIQGYPDGTARPNQTITRAEAAVMMTRALHAEPVTYKESFIDIRHQSYAADYIQAMINRDIFRGYGNDTFRPHISIARGEIATILNRAYTFTPERTIRFPDVPATYFAYEDIAQIAGANIAYGKPNGTFQPHAPVTRAEFAVFLTRALKHEPKPAQAA